MSLWKLILSCAFLSACSADPTFTMTRSMLDPNRLFWWRTKWASAPILLSVNNAGQSSTATFFFSPTSSLTNGVFEVTFPTGFMVGAGGTGQTYVGQVVQYAPVTYLGGQDYQVTISGLTNPLATGAYGPFALRTRYSANSQQIDVNLTFGSVWIYTTSGRLGSLTVSLTGTTINNMINTSGNTLSYKFTLGVSLWRYDTFILGIDSKWTVDSGATCASADYLGRWNNFNGTNFANPHQLDCVVTTGFVYIYGLAVDGIDLTATADNAYVDLRVTSVTTPNAVYAGSAFSWTASTCRFGTTTILETATYTGGPTVTTGVISSATWTPTWGLANSAIATGTTYFMDLSFTITNAIPANGQIIITVTENISPIDPLWVPAAAGGAASNCYIVPYLGSYLITCTTVLNSIALTPLPALAAGTAIKVRNIVTFLLGSGATEQINSVSTYDANGNPIDSGVNLSIFVLAANTAPVATFTTSFVNNGATGTLTVNQAANTSATQAIIFSLGIAALPDFTASTSVTINCPFTSDIEDFGITTTVATATFAYTATGTTVAPLTALTTNVPILTPSLNYSTQGNIVFSGNIGQAVGSATLSFTTVLNLLLYTTTKPYISLPRVSNNLATAYECSIMITTLSAGSTVPSYSAGARFVIAAQTWSTGTWNAACSSYRDGIPVMFSIQPTILGAPPSANSGATYYVEIGLVGSSPNFGANSNFVTTPVTTQNYQASLNSAFTAPYPVITNPSQSISVVTYYANAVNYVAMTGLTIAGFTGGPAAPVTVLFPIGGYSILSNVTPTVSTYYILTTDPRYKFIIHSAALPKFTFTGPLISIPALSSPVIGASNTNINGQTATTPLALGLYSAAAGTYNTSYYIYFLFPIGWTWSSSKSITSYTSTAYTNTYYFSLNSSFGYPGALLYVSTTVSLLNGFKTSASTGTATITLAGFVLPLGVASTFIYVGLSNNPPTSGCRNYGQIAYTTKVGAITSLTVSPTSIKTKGPDGVNVNHQVIFTLTHGVPASGSITLTFSISWFNPGLPIPYTYCTVAGLKNISATTPAICTLNANIAVVTGFADFSTISSTQVIIGIYGIVSPTTPSAIGIPFVTALASNIGPNSGSALIDSATVFTGTFVKIATSSGVGSSNWIMKQTYPMIIGTTGVDLYLKFTLTHSLPAYGVITLSTPLPFLYSSGPVNNWSFLSPIQYMSSVITASNLVLTLTQPYSAGSVLELYLESAVNNPINNVATTGGFKITSTWGGAIIDQDSGPTTSSQTFIIPTVLTNAITAYNSTDATLLSFAPTTTGEAATYIFDFEDSVDYEVGDQYWIVFPSQFDYFLGRTWIWFTNEPSSYYIDCSSTQLGTTWCTVNHNILVVSGSNATSANSEIVININNVVNPLPGQTGAFQIYHVANNGTYLSFSQNIGTVTPTAYPTNLYVRSLLQSDNRLFQPSTYTWRLYIIDVMSLDSELHVLFPQEFDLYKFDKKSSYSCSSTWLDNSVSATIKTQQNWNPATTCTISGNVVSLPPTNNPATFIATSIVTWTIQGVTNTQWGQPRLIQSAITDFDIQDSTLWPVIPYWGSKFTFFVYHTTTMGYTSRSYPNTNAAYAGFIDGLRTLYVNYYYPQSKTNRIIVYTGTQTPDIYITTASASQSCSAKQIVLTPTTNSKTPDYGKLTYTSVINNWILFQSYWQIQFRVSAAPDLIKGLYYIDWRNTETKQTGTMSVQYDTPASTLVEVIETPQNFLPINVATIPTVSIGSTSIPIQVFIPNAPYSDVTITISVVNPPDFITLISPSLTFGPETNSLYFQININGNYTIYQGATQALEFNVTGSQASLYTITSPLSFPIGVAVTPAYAGNVVSWGLATPMKTIATIAPAIDQVGVIYYQLSAFGTAVPSFSMLKAAVGTLVYTNTTNSTTASKNVTISSAQTPTSQSDPLNGESWAQFQHRLYKIHLQTVWVGSIVMTSTTAATTVTFNWLYAATQYEISGYLDNQNPTVTPLVHTESFTTAAIAAPQPFSVLFNGNVGFSFATKIAQEAANLQGVNPLRLGNATFTQNIHRMLVATSINSTTFAYVLVPNRFSESPDPSTQAQITGTALTTFTNNLIADGITQTLLSVKNGVVPARTVPVWTTVPMSAGATATSIAVSFLSNIPGSACCEALTSSNTQPTPEQVMLGLDPTNAAVSNACITTDLTNATNTLQILNLTSGTSYYAFCTAMDNYTLWPTQMSYSALNPMSYVAISTVTVNVSTNSTSASYIGGILLLLGLILH